VGLSRQVLAIDCEAEAERIALALVEIIARKLRRRGAVLGLSGGVDSSVCAALAVRALGREKVLALLMPERESSARGLKLGEEVAAQLGIAALTIDLTPALEAVGCYRERDAAAREAFPDFGADWKCKIVLAGGMEGGLSFFKLVVQDPGGATMEKRLPHRAYLRLIAAQSFKQRVRKMVEYYHADRVNYAVVGTPNRLEYDQGFFVKNGDGSADVKPIAHLYKTQVYALARHLGLPREVVEARPTTDTYSLPQGQDEFYFALPYEDTDLALWALNHGVPESELAAALGVTVERASFVYRDIRAKRGATRPLHSMPLLVEPVAEVAPL
jgi:NAD+ synthase